MSALLVFPVLLFVIYCFVSWIVPKILTWIFKFKFNIVLNIGRIGIPYLKLYDVNITRKGFTVHIEEISINSSFLNSDLTKLITLVVKDVRINRTVDSKVPRASEAVKDNKFDFRGKTVPRSVTTFAQFMAVHIYNISAILLWAELPGSLVHASVSELHVDGSVIQNLKTLVVNVNLSETCAKILRHSARHVNEDTCLMEISFAINLEATLLVHGPLSFESLTINMSQTNAVINEGFYGLGGKSNTDTVKERPVQDISSLYVRLSPIIPKLKRNLLVVTVNLAKLMITYTHSTIFKWYKANILKKNISTRNYGDKNDDTITDTSNKINKYKFLEKLAQKYTIDGSAQFEQVQAIVRLEDDGHSSVSMKHLKLNFHQTPDIKVNHQWQIEMLVETLCWSLTDLKHQGKLSKKLHIWGVPLYLGMALIKWEQLRNAEIKTDSLFDTLQLEWSQQLTDYVLLAFRCLKDYGIGFSKHSVSPKQRNPTNISTTLSLTHLNCFFQLTYDEYAVLRLNNLQIEKHMLTTSILTENLKVLTLRTFAEKSYNCARCEDISTFNVYVNSANVDILKDGAVSHVNVEFLNEVVAFWSCTFHLKLLGLMNDVKDFGCNLKQEMGVSVPSNDPNTESVYNLHIFAVTTIYIEISMYHHLKLRLDNLKATYEEHDLSLQNSNITIFVDEDDIFTLSGLSLFRIKDSELIKEERRENEFNLPWNKTWNLTIQLFKVCFPYEHKFAEAVQNELVSVIKWLKKVHSSDDGKSSKSSLPLPSDILINVQEFIFEMSDDPFEIKLRENFVLLEDEYNESLKRQKMLNDKVGELCKTHLHLPAGKLDELYAQLKRKNAEIYIQRSKQLSMLPSRTRLFSWNVTNVEIMILADFSIHGPEKVINVMREIDFETPWPEEGLEFSTLWCRVISFRCFDWKFQLRDFPQPLMHIQDFYICGQLVGAEEASPRRGKGYMPRLALGSETVLPFTLFNFDDGL